MGYLSYLANWMTELLWPVRCAACGRLGAPACAGCLSSFKPARLRCIICGHHNRAGLPCPGCRGRTCVDRVLASTMLSDAAEIFVHAMKYQFVQSLAIPLADKLCDVLGMRRDTAGMFGSNPVIIPVPLHQSRERTRGYNQAALLAARIAAITAMPLDTTSLVRVRTTGPQTLTTSRLQRRDNMLGAFAVTTRDAVANHDVILVDDVITTGATIEDCARALKEAGAHSVCAIAVAHG